MNLLANLRNGELSFEVRARSNLEVDLISVVIVTVNVVTVNIVNVAFSSFIVTVETLTSEVSIRSTTVVVDVCAGKTVILVDHHLLKALNVALSSTVEFTDVFIEFILKNVDFAFNLTFKFSNSAVNFTMSFVFFARKLRNDG